MTVKIVVAKYARRRVELTRDEAGVAHVRAGSWREALYGLGYMHGVDRPTQILFARAVASGRSAELIADKTGYKGELRFDPSQPDGQPRRCLDTSRAREWIGYEPSVFLREGLDRTIEWYTTMEHSHAVA